MRWLVFVGMLVACGGHARRPTITGAELYAQVTPLHETGAAKIRDVTVRTDQTLATATQQYLVSQLVEGCRGGDETDDAGCMLALLVGERFEVRDRARESAPASTSRREPREDRSRSMISAGVVLGLTGAALTGLGYGVATCEFEGCEVVFGAPLVLGGIGILLLVLEGGH